MSDFFLTAKDVLLARARSKIASDSELRDGGMIVASIDSARD
jgi:hypothetical protein